MRGTSYYWIQNRVAVRVIGPVHEWVSSSEQTGCHVMEEDWDNLIVLDACRVDLFEEEIDLDLFDDYDTVTSLGSTSSQWINRNFGERECGDTVYVTSNMHVPKNVPNQFHDLIEVVPMDDIDVAHPESVCDAAVECASEYPSKRKIIHFMQPHMPFIASSELVYRKHDRSQHDGDYGGRDDPKHVFEAVASGAIDRERFWNAYRANLRLAFDEALELAHELGGKSVFTADHGNMVGERTWPVPIPLYGHPRGVRTPEIVEVPWAVLTTGERIEWIDGGARSRTDLVEEEIDRQLTYLGYNL